MKKFFIILLPVAILLFACSGNKSKESNKAAGDGVVPKIEMNSLNSEPAILGAMQKVVDARIADNARKDTEPGYAGHYVELTNLYTEVLKASTAFSNTLRSTEEVVAFNNKLTGIQDRMYKK
jgi:hypothetical protein